MGLRGQALPFPAACVFVAHHEAFREALARTPDLSRCGGLIRLLTRYFSKMSLAISTYAK